MPQLDPQDAGFVGDFITQNRVHFVAYMKAQVNFDADEAEELTTFIIGELDLIEHEDPELDEDPICSDCQEAISDCRRCSDLRES